MNFLDDGTSDPRAAASRACYRLVSGSSPAVDEKFIAARRPSADPWNRLRLWLGGVRRVFTPLNARRDPLGVSPRDGVSAVDKEHAVRNWKSRPSSKTVIAVIYVSAVAGVCLACTLLVTLLGMDQLRLGVDPSRLSEWLWAHRANRRLQMWLNIGAMLSMMIASWVFVAELHRRQSLRNDEDFIEDRPDDSDASFGRPAARPSAWMSDMLRTSRTGIAHPSDRKVLHDL